MTAVLVPVKRSPDIKSRLSGILTSQERRRLMTTLLEDLGSAINKSTHKERILMVGGGDEARRSAHLWGWEVRNEDEQHSESRSVDEASRYLEDDGVEAVLRLPADLPLIQADDIDRLLASVVAAPGVVAVSDREGLGTNALLRSPPTVFPSYFGPGSFQKHRDAAKEAGASFQVLKIPGIEHDLDTPEDILSLLRRKPTMESRSSQYLRSLRLGERMDL